MMRYFKPLKSNVLEHNLIYSNNILLNHHHLQSVFILFLSMSGVLYWFLEMLRYVKQPLPLRSLLSNRKNKHEQIIATWYARWTQLSDFTLTFHFHALEKEMATHCSVLAWRIPGMEEPGGLPSMGSHRVKTRLKRLSSVLGGALQVALVVKNLPASTGDMRDLGSIPGLGRSPEEGHDNPLQYSCLKNPTDRGDWRATGYWVAKSQTWLKGLSTQYAKYNNHFDVSYKVVKMVEYLILLKRIRESSLNDMIPKWC